MAIFAANKSRYGKRLRQRTLAEIARAAEDGVAALERRVRSLDRDWHGERGFETGATTLAVAGALLGLTRDRRWYFLSAGMALLLAGQALRSGDEPPVFGRRPTRLNRLRTLKSLRRH